MSKVRVLWPHSRQIYLALISCFTLTLFIAGCSNGAPTNFGSPTPVPTVHISANSSTIAAGGSVTITVTATNATGVTITGTDGSSYTLSASGGTQKVSPTKTTTYTAIATGPGGNVSANMTVTVAAAVATTVSITATPSTITAGGSAMLSVTATNATGVTIKGTDGSSYTLQGTGGTQSVSPSVTTTYTVTATGQSNTATASAIVTVTAAVLVPPTISIMASPTSISAGSSSKLTVAATNATTVTLTGSDGSTYTLAAAGGTPSVSPSMTTTYTATATGPGGKTSAAATVTVIPNPPPVVSIIANPSSMKAGSSSILSVTATNATTVTLTGTDHSSYPLTPSGGTQSVDPNTTTTYTVTAVGPGGTTSASTTLTVTPNPLPTVTATANPTYINVGSSSTITVVASNATTVTLGGSDGTTYTLQSNGGTQTVTPTSTTTYTATAVGPGGTSPAGNPNASATVTVVQNPPPTVGSFTANPTTIVSGNTATLTVSASNATQVIITGSDGSSYTLQPTGGTQTVTPTATTTYTVTATATEPDGTKQTSTQSVTVTVKQPGSVLNINHVVFMLQENHTFDNYFGMLNPYRIANKYNIGADGNTYNVDGIDDKLNTISNQDDAGNTYPLFKLKSTCIDDESSDWLASYGDVNRYDFLATRPINMDGFVHNAEGFATSCNQPGASCSGTFTDTVGQRAMGYYDQTYLNYYYYMASQFALSDRWFTPMSSKSIDNRIATFSGGTTQGLVKDPGNDDKLPQLDIPTIFRELTAAKVSWRIYYTVSVDLCVIGSTGNPNCTNSPNSYYPATDFSSFTDSYQYLYTNTTPDPTTGKIPACTTGTQPSSVVGDTSNSFCIDTTHLAPLSQYFTDLNNGNLPSFAFIEAGYGNSDEHPGSGQSVLAGQAQVANIINKFMTSAAWKDSVFFLAYDEGGGPYEHVPPVPGHTNDNTDTSLGITTDISSIAVNPDSYNPCVPPAATTPPTLSLHCDLSSSDPGANPTDAAAEQGFAAQLGFRVPNMVISPFTRQHYVSHIPMDHTAVIKFVEDRFISGSPSLTARDKAQPNLLDFFDFNNVPWATPPTPPTPISLTDPSSAGYGSCTPASMGP